MESEIRGILVSQTADQGPDCARPYEHFHALARLAAGFECEKPPWEPFFANVLTYSTEILIASTPREYAVGAKRN